MTRALLPWLKKSREPRAVFLTSMMGSIADNTSAGSVAYRSSKTALNMMVRCLSIAEPWLTCALLHPGWVKTRMGGPEALITTEESVRGMLQVLSELKPKSSGAFLDYEGDPLPW
ncbi:SDR family NAD(P)-dependent oxidoreductase [bacterium]|nr:SDR family NAD(P)-dependent oxidoreductase [bacterium]